MQRDNARMVVIDSLNGFLHAMPDQRHLILQLHELLASALGEQQPGLSVQPPVFVGFRAGDVRHSLADIGKARSLLGYEPSHDVRAGLGEAVGWYVKNLA